MENFNLKKYLAESRLLKEELTPLQQYVYNYEKEVSGEDEANGFLDGIKNLNTPQDVYDYYAIDRGWEGSDLENISKQVKRKFANLTSNDGLTPLQRRAYSYAKERFGNDEAKKSLDQIKTFKTDKEFTDWVYQKIDNEKIQEHKNKNKNKMNNFDLRKYLAEGRLLKEGIPQESEIADYVTSMYDDSVEEKEGFQSDIWTKEEYTSPTRSGGSTFIALMKHLKSVGGKDVLEGNPDIHLELLSNGDIKWSADVTLNEQKEEELELDKDYDKGGKYYSEDGAEAFRIQPFKMNDIEYTKHEANRMGRYIVGLDGQALKQFISDYMGAFEADKGETELGRTFK